MAKLGSSKVDLSSITSEKLWEKSGRLSSVGSELFRFKDRKDTGYLLSPTHEEEVTTLVSSSLKSYKDLPVRVHQISRKYRDELRPRHGLLRSREFIMKDLYTFDQSIPLALSTYYEVTAIYAKLFDELKIPYLVAEADSGDMGGNLSHEFHFPTTKGEDHIISCKSCGYVSNEEKAIIKFPTEEAGSCDEMSIRKWHGISQDRSTLLTAWYPSSNDTSELNPVSEVNIRAVKAVYPDLDSSVDSPNAQAMFWAHQAPQSGSELATEAKSDQTQRLIHLVDGRISSEMSEKLPLLGPSNSSGRERLFDARLSTEAIIETWNHDPKTEEPLSLLKTRTGDTCPQCNKDKVVVQEAIELGHTFHLGSRYSKPLEANILLPVEVTRDHEEDYEFTEEGQKSSSRKAMIQMGCHGIGVSRMIGAVADTLADEKGLNWPRVMAPFDAVIIPLGNGQLDEAPEVIYDALLQSQTTGQAPLDLVIDDRKRGFAWRMNDADLVGYPVIIVVGKKWASEKICEVQCRRLKVRQDVPFEELPTFVNSLLDQL
ncbi:Class II aaRS and biotin synthetase [Glarea lozoyensis ATCC 20868]|uniref:proline--tRNA ligase n=1 Tax=Glarea lozoyensis (strain ATCC 20868 / MF5171) TaxID=1116229 RepID=S3CK36_GLAL2|nr:Class II aaRS and biotin synthetase [Glarea lozoyensis ATCC 20868]EPE26862.1 Class II aaRS and biotin synthetase [Glarea lozoyensis ATCC 20868]